MRPASRIAFVALCFVLALRANNANEDGTEPPTPAQLAAIERLRPSVNAIWADVRTPSDAERPRYFWEITDRLIALGPDVVPFLTSEIDLMDPDTFHFSTYALGQLGGPEAEATLRKAARIADARGGGFGRACKRFALFGLALLAKPDAMELLQQGESLHGSQMTPYYPFVSQIALLIGPAAVPVLAKQLDAFGSDPTATDKLEDTILALGHAGDASIVPKLVPFLTSATPSIRAVTADSLTRLAEPDVCEKLLPLLASADRRERAAVAIAFQRWKPEPCYKAIVGRLEVEDDTAVRGALLNAIIGMGGESALDVLRLYVRSGNQFDRALVILDIGRVGSKKGLGMLRSLLPDCDDATCVRALEAIAAIGGEGATDTIVAATGDRRPYVAAAALEILANLRIKEFAPRVAETLLSEVREPVGNLSFRTPIAKQAEALVAVAYTDPVDDLSAAAAVQSDSEIKETLTSCVRRLRLLAKNGDNVSAWATETASPFVDVRMLADRRLAAIGSASAVRAIAARLAQADLPPNERTNVLSAIGEARTEGAAALVARHLSDPAYDVWTRHNVRSAAAWAARRIGGKRMAAALRESAVRRDGRDWTTLVYLAVLEKEAALDTVKTLRVRRMRYPEPDFGRQAPLLDTLVADLAGGRRLTLFDVPPEGLSAL